MLNITQLQNSVKNIPSDMLVRLYNGFSAEYIGRCEGTRDRNFVDPNGTHITDNELDKLISIVTTELKLRNL